MAIATITITAPAAAFHFFLFLWKLFLIWLLLFLFFLGFLTYQFDRSAIKDGGFLNRMDAIQYVFFLFSILSINQFNHAFGIMIKSD